MTDAADREAFLDAFNLLCGEQVGSCGMSRTVFACELLPDCVVKVEKEGGYWQNVMEWKLWHYVCETPDVARWFAPCEWISPNGKLLIMKRTTPATRFPERLPAFLTDMKRTNFGMYRGRLVCHDYGVTLAMGEGVYTKRTKKAEWYDA